MRKVLNIFTSFFLLVVLSLGVFFLKDRVNFSGKASGTPANLSVDLGDITEAHNRPWAHLAQGGEEKGRSLERVVGNIQKLGPKYIRIDHIYDYFDVVQSDGSYNWSQLDAYIKDITLTGAKPFLSLSYMPKNFGVASEIDIPSDLSRWTNLVKTTIEHVSGKNGLSLSDVYYEVWNEPDLFGSFKVYPPKNYLDLYRAASNGATGTRNTLPFKFGGPATTALYKNWFDAMVGLKGVRVDFFSWHRYSDDLDALSQDMKNISEWGAPAELEFFITESGIDSANNPSYDGVSSAVHTISEAAITSDKIKGLFSFEIKDGPGPSKNWGRWGLLTHEKWGEPVEKPRFGALIFLNRMKGSQKFAVDGSGSFVKAFGRKDGDVYRLLVVNYDPNGKHVEAVPVAFTNIPANASLRRIDYLGSTTSIVIPQNVKDWNSIFYFKANSAAIFEFVTK